MQTCSRGRLGAVGELCRADGVKGGSFRERGIGRAGVWVSAGVRRSVDVGNGQRAAG